MPKIEYRLFGYRRIKGEEGKENKLATHLVRLGIAAEMCEDGSFVISERDFKRFKRYAGGRVRYTASDGCGIPGVLKRNLSHIPTALAILFGLIINILLAGLVWDVRVSGNERVSEEMISDALDEVGFGVGTIWSLADKEMAEAALLESMGDISWVSINRRGTVAYVEVKETEGVVEEPQAQYVCSNIVATTDCVIEEINVVHGRALVKAGDVVSRGDIIISGVIETEAGTFFTRAEGSVRAHIVEEIAAEATTEETATEQDTTRVCERGIRIFGSYINIFKNYGNLPKDCVIIDDEVVWVIGDGHKMPISLVTKYASIPTEVKVTHQASDLPALASSRLMEAISSAADGADLVKLRTSGKYIDGGYRMVATLILSKDIGEEVEVTITDR